MTECFQADERCLGFYLRGSVVEGTADSFSDVDAAIVVDAIHYPLFLQTLRTLCEQECGPSSSLAVKTEREAYSDYAVALQVEMDLFAKHAHDACRQFGITEYPIVLENGVRHHLLELIALLFGEGG